MEQVKFNKRHSEFPDEQVYKTTVGQLRTMQGTIMEEKVRNIQLAIMENKSFDPFIVYPGTKDIFDGHHRYHAIIKMYGKACKVSYIEDNRKEDQPEQGSDIMNEIDQIKQQIKELNEISNKLRKEPVTSETTGYHNPSYSDDIEDDIIKGKLEDCVQRKIPIIHNEHPDWANDHVVAAAYGYCREHMGLKKRE